MEELIRRLHATGHVTFLSPHVPIDSGAVEINQGYSGKYHDRFVLECNCLSRDKLAELIDKCIDEVVAFFCQQIDALIETVVTDNTPPAKRLADGAEIEEILRDYLQVRYVVLPWSEAVAENPVKVVDEHLDTLEQWRSFHVGPLSRPCFKCQTLDAVVEAASYERENNVDDEQPRNRPLCPLCFFKLFCFRSEAVRGRLVTPDGGANGQTLRYPPLIEIAAAELVSRVDKAKWHEAVGADRDYDFEIFDGFDLAIDGKVSSLLKTYHKYVAVVRSDGDNLSRVVGTYGLNPREVSNALFNFSEQAVVLCEKYGGRVVFAGGDDLLAFVPVVTSSTDSEQRWTVLDFVQELREMFIKVMTDAQMPQVTLSIGISLAYYKYPLARMIEEAEEMLWSMAKGTGKDRVALSLRKHSGRRTQIVLPFSSGEFDQVRELFSKIVSEEIKVPRGVHHNLHRSIEILSRLRDPERIAAFFANNFSEHESLGFGGGLTEIQKLVIKRLDGVSADAQVGKRLISQILDELYVLNYLRGREV